MSPVEGCSGTQNNAANSSSQILIEETTDDEDIEVISEHINVQVWAVHIIAHGLTIE